MGIIKELRQEIQKVLDESMNKTLTAQRKMIANSVPRSLHFTGSFGCNSNHGLIHINIPTGTDEVEKLDSIINRVLENELSITLDECKVVQNAVGMSNKVIEFYLPRGMEG